MEYRLPNPQAIQNLHRLYLQSQELQYGSEEEKTPEDRCPEAGAEEKVGVSPCHGVIRAQDSWEQISPPTGTTEEASRGGVFPEEEARGDAFPTAVAEEGAWAVFPTVVEEEGAWGVFPQVGAVG